MMYINGEQMNLLTDDVYGIIIVKKGGVKMTDYKTILEEILEMLEGDLQTLKTEEAQKYVSNVIQEIKDSLK